MDDQFTSYQSPFSWRYGSAELRKIWSEYNKRLLWRSLWVSLAETQQNFGLVSSEQAADLRLHANEIDISRSLEVEKVIQHDLMAELKVFAEQCPIGGAIIHFGATSMDIKDNAEALQIQQSLHWILVRLSDLLHVIADLMEKSADLPCMAFTHLQPAEPTTYGYRFSNYAQDLLEDFASLQFQLNQLRGKGFKGAVGNAASYVELLGSEDRFKEFEHQLSKRIGLNFFPVSAQTYPRKQEFQLLSALSSLAGSIYKLAFDIRILQSQVIGELSEPFSKDQVGSSAMPFKRNPIQSEKMDSLARMVSAAPLTAWNNFAHSLLERTLDDSANRRTLLPESFLAVDELLTTARNVLADINLNRQMIQQTLEKFGPFAGTERLLMELVKRGADRQQMHELLRVESLSSWQDLEQGRPNFLIQKLSENSKIRQYLSQAEVVECMNIIQYLGIAITRTKEMVIRVRKAIDKFN